MPHPKHLGLPIKVILVWWWIFWWFDGWWFDDKKVWILADVVFSLKWWNPCFISEYRKEKRRNFLLLLFSLIRVTLMNSNGSFFCWKGSGVSVYILRTGKCRNLILQFGSLFDFVWEKWTPNLGLLISFNSNLDLLISFSNMFKHDSHLIKFDQWFLICYLLVIKKD